MSEQSGKVNRVHSAFCGKPLVNGDQFICGMAMDITCGEGPMAGQRMEMKESCLYTFKDGKIAETKFLYACRLLWGRGVNGVGPGACVTLTGCAHAA